MENLKIATKRFHGAITKREGMEMFSPIEEFAKQIGKAVDEAVMKCLDQKIGSDWELEKVSMTEMQTTDPTKQGKRYLVEYDGVPVGIIRNTVVVQNNKAIGNLYVEMMEVATA